ncbi:MAG: transcription elongation factor GreA, partial [Oscillospiraceae bacterium]|nr:transcription elongation factor GreA [Oscillospiraceae bacterium]
MTDMKEVIMTSEGYKKLVEELEYLKTTGRDEAAEKIRVARGFGDLSENSEYDEAKNDQAALEARIAELEAQLKHARIMDESEMNSEHVH